MTALSLSMEVSVPPEEVFFSLTNPNDLRAWLGNIADLDPREGGRFYVWWNDGYHTSGQVEKIVKDERIELTWRGQSDPSESQVAISLDHSQGKTVINLHHSWNGDGKEWEEASANIESRWQASLENLQSYLETGNTKKFLDAPILGITGSGMIDEDRAEALGTPVTQGMEISTVSPGTGAGNAGLEPRDVLYKLAGVEVTSFADYSRAIGPHKAGDEIEVVFYRGAEEHVVPLTLIPRPLPEISDSPKEVAAQLGEVFAALDAELDEIFSDCTEEQARKRPAPDEWCAKEVVAHLLYTENWFQIDYSLELGGQRSIGFHNDLGLIAGIANSYPTVGELINALKHAERASAAAVEALSEKDVNRKGMYYRILNWPATGVESHSKNHFEQIRAAINAAKEK